MTNFSNGTLVFIIFESLAFIVSVCGNSMIVYIMITKKELARTSNKYILSVAFADLLYGIYVIPLGVVQVSHQSPCFQFITLSIKMIVPDRVQSTAWLSNLFVYELFSNVCCHCISYNTFASLNWQIFCNLLSNIAS